MGLLEFQMRLMERGATLKKALDPEDFRFVLAETSPKGSEIVDHVPELKAHPPIHDASVQRYNQGISANAPIIRKTPQNLIGATAKVVLTLPHSGNLPGGDKYIIKPYHEVVDPRTAFWQHHLIQGWAEMTNQALWHAAGMGQMHQRVHVSEHTMGPGHEKEPAIVIRMTPDANFIDDMTPREYSLDMHDELPKIAVMDFLSNNMDRHTANLMFLPAGAVDELGQPVQSRLLAIDHGRSFQYHASHKGAPRFVDDPQVGRMPVDPDIARRYEELGKTTDSFLNYVRSMGLMEANQFGMMFGEPSIMSPQGLFPDIIRWWPQVRQNVIQAWGSRLHLIRNSEVKAHLEKNFKERVALLDRMIADPDYWLHHSKAEDMKIPLHVL